MRNTTAAATAKPRRPSPPSVEAALLEEVKGLRKDLVVAVRAILGEVKRGRHATPPVTSPDPGPHSDASKVLAHILSPTWDDPIHDLDAPREQDT